ncbi:MAG: hypothetical protein LBD20_06140 [Spirochaetaceae bacterium]|jgi:DNA polymerase V|nr:hypothetical protein [Spirochaetaceae bacterium]
MGVFGLGAPAVETGRKATGFASPAQGYEGRSFDFNRMLVKNPPSTFIMRQESDEMAAYGIFKGSLLVVDRSIRPRSGAIVVLSYEGVFLCRCIFISKEGVVCTNGEKEMRLHPAAYEIFGTVTSVVRNL